MWRHVIINSQSCRIQRSFKKKKKDTVIHFLNQKQAFSFWEYFPSTTEELLKKG